MNEKKIVKKYKNLPHTDIIRVGKNFINDFLFEDKKAVEIPINALRIIFNVISDLRNEQIQPQTNAKQLSLFEENFQTENNTYASMKIKNKLI